MKRSYTSLLLAVLCCAGSLLTPPLHAQGPPWECINSPEMTGHAQVVVNSSGDLFYTCANQAAIRPSGQLRAGIRIDVPAGERASIRIALDDTSTPWMISDRHFYRATFQNNQWSFTTETRAVQTDPVFFTITPWSGMYISDPFGCLLHSTDQGQTWTHAGPVTAGPARGMRCLPDSSILMWTAQLMYRSTDRGASGAAIPLPDGLDGIRHVYADRHGYAFVGLRGTASSLYRSEKPEYGWELLYPSLGSEETIRQISGYMGALLLLVDGVNGPRAMQLPAGESRWLQFDGLYLGTTQYEYYHDGRVLIVRTDYLTIADAPGAEEQYLEMYSSATDADAMLCVDDHTFVMYKYMDGFYRSTDDGQTWSESYDHVSNYYHELHFGQSLTNMYAMFNDTLFLSSDGGASWQGSQLPGKFYNQRVAECMNGDIFLVGRYDDGIIRSTNFGESWHEVRLGATYRSWPPTLCAVDDELFLLVNDSLLTSTDHGWTWEHVREFSVT